MVLNGNIVNVVCYINIYISVYVCNHITFFGNAVMLHVST